MLCESSTSYSCSRPLSNADALVQSTLTRQPVESVKSVLTCRLVASKIFENRYIASDRICVVVGV